MNQTCLAGLAIAKTPAVTAKPVAQDWQERVAVLRAWLLGIAQPILAALEEVHWVSGGDEGPNYCYEHAKAEVEKLQAKDPNNAEDYSVGGGYGSSEDGLAVCDKCGKLLAYSLTDHGVGAELEHFESVRLSLVGLKNYPGTAYAVLRVISDGLYVMTNPEGETYLAHDLKQFVRRLEAIHKRAQAH
jgi:hypothetical protein